MKIIIAPQALKGSLEASDVARASARGIQKVWPQAECILLPVADGGEGTVRALVEATGGQITQARVTGPLGEEVAGFFGILGAQGASEAPTAVIEMAAAAGLPLVPQARRNPLLTTTRGVGELIRLALDHGCRRLIIGIGGSATNDGGAGMAQALGAALLDEQGADLPPGGAALARLSHISLAHLDQRLHETEILVACDVTNPLCGPEGASAIHSAEPSFALREDWLVLNVHPFVLSVIVSVNFPPPLYFTSAVKESPGETGLLRFTGNFGYISYQA